MIIADPYAMMVMIFTVAIIIGIAGYIIVGFITHIAASAYKSWVEVIKMTFKAK